MKFLATITICLLAASAAASATPRFAVVRVKEIYTALPSTTALTERVAAERAAIMKNERAAQLRESIADLQTIQGTLSDEKTDVPTRQKLARTYELKRQEAQTLQEEFESYRKQQEKEINRRMVADMRTALDRIAGAARKIAAERGYDVVLDSSGETNTSQPFVLYSKDAPDLTADVQAALKDSAPPKAQPVSPPKSKR